MLFSLCPLTVDSALLFPFWRAQESRTTALVLTEMLAVRQAQSWSRVCPLSPDDRWPPEQHLPWGLGSSLPLVRMGADRARGFLENLSRGALLRRPEVQEKHRPVLWTNSGIPGSQNSRFLYVRCPDLWGTQTQCLSFPAREMGLRDMGWGGLRLECVLVGLSLVGVQE